MPERLFQKCLVINHIQNGTMRQKYRDDHNGIRALKGMWSPRARGVYIAELTVFALPALVTLGYVAVIVGVGSGRFFLESAWSLLLHGGAENIIDIIGSAMGIGLAAVSISALFIFVRLSFDYLRGRQVALAQAARRYWFGLLCAVPALLLNSYGMFVSTVVGPMRDLFPVLAVNFAIVIPVSHLGFALHAGRLSQKL